MLLAELQAKVAEQEEQIEALQTEIDTHKKTIHRMETNRKSAKWEPDPDAKPCQRKASRVFLMQLRAKDREFNHTCGCCLKRKPVEDFYRLKKDEFCIECREK